MKLAILPILFLFTATLARAGEQTTKIHCASGKIQADVEMDEIGDNFLDITAKGAKKSYANNSSNPNNKAAATLTAVLDENVGVLAVVGLNIADNFTIQETTLVSVPKTYIHKPSKGSGPADASFSANLTGPMTNNLNLLMKCSLKTEI